MNLTILPDDIQIRIMEYMVPHLCPTKRDRDRIQKHVIQRHIYNITKKHSYTTYGRLYDYLNHDKEHIFKVLTSCKCCLRHQRYRPTTITDNVTYIQNTEYLIDEIVCKLHICACPCRHITRFITRHFRDL